MTKDLMTEIAEIITDMRRMEYDRNDPMRHCKSELKRLARKILADAASQARDALFIVERIQREQARAESGSLEMQPATLQAQRAIARATGEQP